jgi:hypothetical protein
MYQYHIWFQRNARFHAGQIKYDDSIIEAIIWEVKARVLFKGSYRKYNFDRVLCCK